MTKQSSILHHDRIGNAITSEDILGKDVIDRDGHFVGISDRMYIDPMTLLPIGISVDKGFLKKGLVIGADYVDRVTSHAVMLSIRPVFRVANMQVFDKEGALLGRVREVELAEDANDIKAVIVRRGFLRKKELRVPQKCIAKVGASVLLNCLESQL